MGVEVLESTQEDDRNEQVSNWQICTNDRLV